MKERNTSKTRRIWIKHHGKIPKDANGRSYEIHHIDGNPENDEISNLLCVTIDDHYEIHKSQGDWMACHRMAKRMKKSPEEISKMGSLAQKKRVDDGIHNFTGGELQRKRVEDGTHHLLGGAIQSDSNKKRWDDGTHALDGYNEKRIENGTHNFQRRQDGGSLSSDKVEDGSHIWIQEWSCEHCGKSGKNMSLFTRWGHNDGSCLEPKTFLPQNTDHQVYGWKNKNTGDVVNMTRYQLSRTYGVRPQDIYNLITKRRKSTHGWTLM